MSKRQSARDRAFVAKLKTIHFPERDSPWTKQTKHYVSSLVRPQFAELDPKTGKGKVDPEAFVSNPAEAREVLKRQGRLAPETEIEAVR